MVPSFCWLVWFFFTFRTQILFEGIVMNCGLYGTAHCLEDLFLPGNV